MKHPHLIIHMFILTLISAVAVADSVGQWDSTIYNMTEHPRTVALRIEVVDSDTRLPVDGAKILFKGQYNTESRTSRDPEGEQDAEVREYELSTKTDDEGVAIGAFGWQKQYPWGLGSDDVEKVQSIEVRHPNYNYIEIAPPFRRLLNVGQRPDSTIQEPAIFDKFEKTWHDECARNDVKYCVCEFGTQFPDYGSKSSKRPEFFENIRNRDWGKTYKEPRNWFSKGEGSQSLCGPYFVYLIDIQMKKLKRHGAGNQDVSQEEQKETPVPTSHIERNTFSVKPTDVQWQLGFLEGIGWGMEGQEVERILTGKGYKFEVVNSYQDPDTLKVAHSAVIHGQLLYGRVRVEEIRMSFFDKKLTSVHFVNADNSNPDGLYNECGKLFGPGLEDTWEDKDVKERIGNPDLCRTCKRYFPITLITSTASYTWSSEEKKYIRYASVKLESWKSIDKTSDNDRSTEAMRYNELVSKLNSGEKIDCSVCSGTGKCRKCSGKGKIYDYKFYKCPFPACGGKGWYVVRGLGGGQTTCSTCSGTGKIKSYKQETFTCQRCSGDGKCTECKGEGK